MFEFKEKAVIDKEIADEIEEKREGLNRYSNITPYIIVNDMVKDVIIKTWLKKDPLKNQLILINAVLNGYDVK